MESAQRGQSAIGVLVGLASTLLTHALVLTLLLQAMDSSDHGGPQGDAPRSHRRNPHPEVTDLQRRPIDGPVPRLSQAQELRRIRRGIVNPPRRREASGSFAPSYRSIQQAPGRRLTLSLRRSKARTIDWGPAPTDLVLEAMVVPKLGLAPKDEKKLPRLTKYERPEYQESGINISQERENAAELEHKSFQKKEAQLDRRRKKRGFQGLGNIIDGPDDDDPRLRATSLEFMEGVEWGSVEGTGIEGKEGNVYLSKVTTELRKVFAVPVFLTKDELNRFTVDIEIRQIDTEGHILAYKVRKYSPNQGFNNAALQAVKQFVPSEGGSKRLPAPPPDLLQYINRGGLLIRLEGKNL